VTPLVKIMPHTIVPFISIKKAKKDATFSIDEDFRNDSSDRKVNLSVGAYKSEEGKAVILKSVKQAEQKVLEGETNKVLVLLCHLLKCTKTDSFRAGLPTYVRTEIFHVSAATATMRRSF